MTFEAAKNGDMILTGIITVRQHWRLFAVVALLFSLHAVRIILSPSDLAEAQARIKVHEDHTMTAIDAARARGVAPAERKHDKTILLTAYAREPASALAELNEAITAVGVEIRKPRQIVTEELLAQAGLIQTELLHLRLQLVGTQAMGAVVNPWGADGAQRLAALAGSVENLNKAVVSLGSRANTQVHLIEEPRVTSRSSKPRALGQAGGTWVASSLMLGVGLHAWRHLRGAWELAGKEIEGGSRH